MLKIMESHIFGDEKVGGFKKKCDFCIRFRVKKVILIATRHSENKS